MENSFSQDTPKKKKKKERVEEVQEEKVEHQIYEYKKDTAFLFDFEQNKSKLDTLIEKKRKR